LILGARQAKQWAADFNDASNPAAGGTIKMLLDGTEGQQMFDNIIVNKDGKVIIQEDVGNQTHLGKIRQYDPTIDQLALLAQHDPDRFVTGGPNFITQDEESSGIIDATDILGSAGQNAYLLDVQSHNNVGGELVQGGQLLVMYQAFGLRRRWIGSRAPILIDPHSPAQQVRAAFWRPPASGGRDHSVRKTATPDKAGSQISSMIRRIIGFAIIGMTEPDRRPA
jgi:hypothetical protein